MKTSKIKSPKKSSLVVVVMSLICASTFIQLARAQTLTQGQKGVYNSTGVTYSSLWIDASAFWNAASGTNPDLCVIVNGIITGLEGSSNGVVIDARGLYNNSGSGGNAVKCSESPFPSVTNLPAITLLLPAATIPVADRWTLTNNTRVVGVGQYTNLVAETGGSIGFGTPPYMIEMGSTGTCPSVGSPVVNICTSVGVEHLLLSDPHNIGPGGIDNGYATTSSYVNDVNLNDFAAVGLNLDAPSSANNSPGAVDSGPYSNITFSSSEGATAAVCIDISAQTLGIHGVTCVGNVTLGNTGGGSTTNPAAIYVDASNNSIEDVHIEGFYDGIQIGNTTGTVANVVISNVTGSKSGTTYYNCSGTECLVKNVVHICGASNSRGKCANNGTVQDVTILDAMGISFTAGDMMATIQDDATGTSIVRCVTCEMPLTTAIYDLGESYGGGYVRFASNPSNPGTNYYSTSSFIPTWSVGSLSATIAGQTCLTPGAIFSNTAGSSMSTLFVCTYHGGTVYEWEPLA